jgi:hypothetical protein
VKAVPDGQFLFGKGRAHTRAHIQYHAFRRTPRMEHGRSHSPDRSTSAASFLRSAPSGSPTRHIPEEPRTEFSHGLLDICAVRYLTAVIAVHLENGFSLKPEV